MIKITTALNGLVISSMLLSCQNTETEQAEKVSKLLTTWYLSNTL